MYINDTHILFYVIAIILGLIIGQFTDWVNQRLIEKRKIFSREIITRYKIDFRPNYILMTITSIIYCGLIYIFGMQDSFIENLNLIKYIILTPILLSIFVIDYKLRIIPDRLNLTIFETGAVIAFLYGMSNVAITIDMLFGMIAGAGVFLIITLIGSLIYGKQAMGFGDIKLMGALGLYFGFTNIMLISLMAFFIGAIFAIIFIIGRFKKVNEYIPFGPFIVIAAFISIFVPFELLVDVLRTIFTLGMYKK